MNLQGPILIIAAFLTYSIVHSILAARRVKAWVQNRFGPSGHRYYRLIYNLVGGVSFLPILALLTAFPGDEVYRWSRSWLYLAILMQLLGVMVIIVGLLQTGVWSFFGLSWMLGKPNSGADRLITKGLYRWMRHPLYTGGLLLLWFIPIMTTSLLALNLAATLYLYIGSIFEERRLLAAFGEEYRQYQRQVPRMIPIPWRHI
jgi:protein-S-isoprenylcysteine O-methyltransferase Ste14